MGILDNLIFDPLARAIVKAQRQTAPMTPLIAQASMPYVDKRQLYENQVKAFAACSWVYKAVATIAKSAALVPLHVYQEVGEDREEVANHPLEVLLRRPNNYQSQYEFMEATFGSLLLNGNAFWYVRPTLAGTGGELHTLRPDRMRVVPHETEYVAGYLYEIEGNKVSFDREEVLHFKLYGPGSDYLGLSPIEALAYAIANDTEAQERNYYRQKNNARADGVFSTDQELDENDAARLRREWERAHKGSENVGKVGWLWGGFKWQAMSLTPEEMQFIEGRKLSREEVWQIYDIPMGMWSENATEANAKVGLQVYYNFCLWPNLMRVSSKITSDLLPRYGDDLTCEFEDVRVTDKQLELEEIKTAQSYLTINEIRAEFYDQDELEGGNVVLNAAGDPISGVGEKEEAQPPSQFAMPPTMPQEEPEPSEAEQLAEEEELEKWQKWALARVGTDRWPPKRAFETRFVRPIRAAYVAAALDGATNEQEVKAAFGRPFCGYP